MEGVDYKLSKKFRALWEKHENDASIDLHIFALEIANVYPMPKSASELLAYSSGTMVHGTFWRHMFDLVCYDSVVRDILTVGHLGKLLSRFDVYKITENPRILALPNRLFDAWSQCERSEFFKDGNILPIDTGILQDAAVRAMLDRESF